MKFDGFFLGLALLYVLIGGSTVLFLAIGRVQVPINRNYRVNDSPNREKSPN